MSVCYWIVLSEIASFIMGYPAGGLKPRHYVLVSLFNYLLNSSLAAVLIPKMACSKSIKDSVHPIYQETLKYFFDTFANLFPDSSFHKTIFKAAIGLRTIGLIVQGLTFVQNFKLRVTAG